MENQVEVVKGVAGKVVLALLGGALAGAAFAYLYAPRSGLETREQWTEKLRRGKDRIGTLPAALREASGAAKVAFQKSSEERMSSN